MAAANNANRLRKQELIFALLKNRPRRAKPSSATACWKSCPTASASCARPTESYLASTDDIYISPSQIRRFNLHTGDMIEGEIRTPKDGERYFALVKVDRVNGGRREEQAQDPVREPDAAAPDRAHSSSSATSRRREHHQPRHRHDRADRQGPARPARRAAQDRQDGDDAAHRPRHHRQPSRRHLIVLLIDERPEEVTEMQRTVKGEVVASTFDEPAAAPRAGRRNGDREGQAPGRAQEGRGHPARLHHPPGPRLQHRVPASGKVLTGGVDANALQKPKRFFGAARNIEEGGSLTIIATALIDTGSRMDDVIYEEFKGTGNMEIHLDRAWPRSASTRRSTSTARHPPRGTAAEAEILQKIWILRKLLYNMDEIEAMEFLLDKMKATKNNARVLRRPGTTPPASPRPCSAASTWW
jgi:transcription termination factor Rho